MKFEPIEEPVMKFEPIEDIPVSGPMMALSPPRAIEVTEIYKFEKLSSKASSKKSDKLEIESIDSGDKVQPFEQLWDEMLINYLII